MLRVRVVSMDGSPLSGVWLVAQAEGNASWFAQVLPDADGAFVVTNCPRDRTLSLSVQGSGIVEKRIDGVDPHAGKLVVRVDRLTEHARIVGAVVDPDARPVAPGVVHVRRAGDANTYFHVTEPDGTFAIESLQPGRYTLHVEVDGYVPQHVGPHELAAGATWEVGTLRVARGGHIVVRLDRPLPADASLFARDASGAHVRLSGADKELHSPTLAPGRYVVQPFGGTVAAVSFPADVSAAGETELSITWQQGIPCRITCALPRAPGEPRRVDLALCDPHGRTLAFWREAKADGPAILSCALLPGTWTVTARSGALTAARTFIVEPGAPAEVALALR